MKADWKTIELAQACDVFADGDWIESKDQSEEGIRLIQTGNIGQGEFKNRNEKARYISESTFSRLRCSEIVEGDCLISRLPDPVGRSCILPETGEKMITAVDCTIIRFKPDLVIPEFFTYYSQSREYLYEVDSKTTGTTRKRISRANLGEVRIPAPPLAVQRRIVGTLDKTFAAIATAKANTEKNLLNARALFQSALSTAFSQHNGDWKHTTIGEHIRFIDYRGKTPKKTESGLRLITAKNVKMGYLQRTPEEFVAPGTYKSWMTRGIPRKGDILFTTEAPLANVAQLDTNERVVFAQRIIIMQTDGRKLDPTFLKYLLLSPPIQERIRAKGTGATVQGIKASLLREVEISFPESLEKQLAIAGDLGSFASETQQLQSASQRKLAELEDLKKSLLHQAFSGTL